jgi:hypothetical protein
MLHINPAITKDTKLADLLDCAMDFDQNKADYTGQPGGFMVTPAGRLTTSGDTLYTGSGAAMLPSTFTRHALKQAAGKLGAAYDMTSLPTDYLLTLQDKAPELFAENINGAIDRMPKSRDWFVRTYNDQVRAVLSGEYLKFDNSDMLRLLNDVLQADQTEHKLSSRSFVNPDNMVTDVLFKDIHTGKGNGNGQFSLGVRIRNGEIGDWTGGVYPLIKRTSCDNSISIDDRAHSFTFKHFGKNTATTKRVMLKSAMAEILPFSVNIIQTLIEAEEKELPKFSDIVNGLGFKHGWSEEFTGAVFAGSEARYSLAGLVNGVTFAAHTAAPNNEAMTAAEFLGGALLFDSRGSMLREAEYIHNSRQARDEAKQARQAARALAV